MTVPRLPRWILCAWFLMACLLGWAQAATSPAPAPLELRSDTGVLRWSQEVSSIQELGPSAGLDAVVSGARGLQRDITPDGAFPLGTDRTLWLHLRVQRQADAPQDWWLDIPSPFLDRVTLFLPNGRGGWLAQEAGDTLPVSQWTIPSFYPEFRVRIDHTQATSVWLRVQNFREVSVPLRWSSDAARSPLRALELVFAGAVLGAFLLMLCWNLLRWAETQSSQHGWLFLYALLMGLVCAQGLGLANLWLWPHAPVWANYAATFLPLLGAGFSTLLLHHIAASQRFYPVWDQVLLWSAWLFVPMVALELLLERSAAASLDGMYFVLCAVLGLVTAARLWRDKDRNGALLCCAYLPLGVALVYLGGQKLDWYPLHWAARYALIGSAAVSSALMLHAVVWRSRNRVELKDRVRSAATQDALTGLLVRQRFEAQVRQTIERARHDHHSAAIVLVEVSNFPQLQQAYGLTVAEQSLVRAVIKLHRVLRDVDPAGRVGEARFGLLLEGVSTREDLTERMVGLIASGLIPLAGMEPEITLQFHMAAVMLDEIHPDPDTVLEELGEILSGIAPRTRRPIRFLEPATTLPSPLQRDSGFGHDNSGTFTELAQKARQWGQQRAAKRPMPPTTGTDASGSPSAGQTSAAAPSSGGGDKTPERFSDTEPQAPRPPR